MSSSARRVLLITYYTPKHSFDNKIIQYIFRGVKLLKLSSSSEFIVSCFQMMCLTISIRFCSPLSFIPDLELNIVTLVIRDVLITLFWCLHG